MHMKNTVGTLLLDKQKKVKEDHENYQKNWRWIFFDKPKSCGKYREIFVLKRAKSQVGISPLIKEIRQLEAFLKKVMLSGEMSRKKVYCLKMI